MKRCLSESKSISSSNECSSSKRRSKHREGYNGGWKKQYPRLLSVADHDSPGEICSLLCELCQRYKATQRSGAKTWVSKLCTLLRKNVIVRHCQSNMHKEALDRETMRLRVEHHGGIEQAFQRQVHCICAEKGFNWCVSCVPPCQRRNASNY